MKYQFSVLMSIYDKEKVENLKECLNSLKIQTIEPNEIVVVVDGKVRDELIDVLNYYKVRVVKLPHHVGLGKALFKGVKSCKYDLIARMDCELQLNEFKKNNDLVLVGGQIVEFNSEKIKKKRIVPTLEKDIIKFSKYRNPFNHMTVMFKKKNILNVGNYKPLDYFEDYYLWVRLLKKGYSVRNIDKVLVKARSDYAHTKRRGSIQYIKYMYNFEKQIYSDGYINLFQFIFNIIIRFFMCIIPNSLRGCFYTIFLRK